MRTVRHLCALLSALVLIAVQLAAVSPAQAATATVAGSYRALSPARLMDTRLGTGAPKARVAAWSSVTLQVTGRGGVGATGSVSAAVLNTTVVSPAGSGYVTAFPTGTGRPSASNVNFVAGQTIANLGSVRVGSGGRVTFFNGSAASIDLIVDVSGYYLAGSATAAGTYRALSPARLMDTRLGIGTAKARLAAWSSVTLQVTGRGGVGATGAVSAAVLNTTVVNPQMSGYVTAYPTSTVRPSASNVNFGAGRTIANLGSVRVGSGGKVTFFNGSDASIDLIVDVSGYYLAGSATAVGSYRALSPARLMDTRLGTGAPKARVAAWSSVTLQVTGRGGVGATGSVSAAVLNATVVSPWATGYVTAFPTGTARPSASNVNFVAGQTIANLGSVRVGSGGKVTFFNGSADSIDLIVDVSGYFVDTPPAPRTFGSGTWRVGIDIPAGTYRTRVNPSFCYWERMSGFTGSLDEIIANNITTYHDVVTIAPTDKGFKSDDCGTWTSNLSAITSSKTAPFGPGTMIVNTDIAPGTWRAPGGSGCYWERLSGFSGEFDDLLDNDFGATGPVVTILSSDTGFSSNDCGTWTKIG